MFEFLSKNNIGEPPWEYDFLYNLPESEYPKYLAKIFNYRTGEKLPLKWVWNVGQALPDNHRQGLGSWIIDKKKCKTFNQKIQWIKLNFCRVESPNSILRVRTRSNKKSAETLKGVNGIKDTFVSESKDFKEKNSGYGITDLMRDCTDKVKVRDYVKKKIGSEYLKPVLQIIPDNYVFARNVSDKANQPILEKLKVKNGKLKVNENMVNQLDHFAIARDDSKIIDFIPNPTDVSTYFDQIDWKNLPSSFVIKCNHGCKWQYIIKNKNDFLNTTPLFELVKRNITGWLEQDFSFWGGFEMQYKTVKLNHDAANNNRIIEYNAHFIKPKILIEKLMRDNINVISEEIQWYCFNGQPKLCIRIDAGTNSTTTLYDENLNIINDTLAVDDEQSNKVCDNLIYQSFDLSIELSKDFLFVRVDWMIYQNKLYFEELTFTPYSGFINWRENWKFKIGNWINLY